MGFLFRDCFFFAYRLADKVVKYRAYKIVERNDQNNSKILSANFKQWKIVYIY